MFTDWMKKQLMYLVQQRPYACGGGLAVNLDNGLRRLISSRLSIGHTSDTEGDCGWTLSSVQSLARSFIGSENGVGHVSILLHFSEPGKNSLTDSVYCTVYTKLAHHINL